MTTTHRPDDSDRRPGPAPFDSPGSLESPEETKPGPRQRFDWRLRFALLSLVWGFSFLLIKLGNRGYAPLYVTFGRLLFGAAVLLLALVVRREGLPRGRRTWAHLAAAALFLNAVPFSLFAYAERTIPSVLAGICNAATPLFGMLLSLVALSEDRPTLRRVAGLAVGFGGVLVVLGAWRGFDGQDPVGTVMALGAGASYAVGWLYVRRTLAGSPHSGLSMTAGQLTLGTVQLAVLAGLFNSAPARFPPVPLLAVAALGALGTGTAFLVQYGLVAEVGPTTAQMVTYFVPVIATLAGVLVLHEPLTWNTPVGAGIVLLGAALTQTARRRTRRPKSRRTRQS